MLSQNMCVYLHGRQLPLYAFYIGVLLWKGGKVGQTANSPLESGPGEYGLRLDDRG